MRGEDFLFAAANCSAPLEQCKVTYFGFEWLLLQRFHSTVMRARGTLVYSSKNNIIIFSVWINKYKFLAFLCWRHTAAWGVVAFEDEDFFATDQCHTKTTNRSWADTVRVSEIKEALPAICRNVIFNRRNSFWKGNRTDRYRLWWQSGDTFPHVWAKLRERKKGIRCQRSKSEHMNLWMKFFSPTNCFALRFWPSHSWNHIKKAIVRGRRNFSCSFIILFFIIISSI